MGNVENAFDLLEERVRRAAEALRRLQADNGDLKKQLVRAQGALQQAERAIEAAEKRQATGSPEDRRKLETLARRRWPCAKSARRYACAWPESWRSSTGSTEVPPEL